MGCTQASPYLHHCFSCLYQPQANPQIPHLGCFEGKTQLNVTLMSQVFEEQLFLFPCPTHRCCLRDSRWMTTPLPSG